jgi:UDP-glucuronate decarboxylase
MKYILVTGGAGFIGSNLCKRLLEDKNNFIYCIDSLVTGSEQNLNEIINSERFMFCVYDITNKNTLKDLSFMRIDEIYHLASIASPPKYKEKSIETLFTNFEGTRNILELALKYNAKFLFTSTSEVYGDPLIHPQVEEYFGNVNTLGERSCYDEGKRVAETLIYEYRRVYNLNCKIVRLFNTYGPFMDINDGRVITNFIKSIQRNEPLSIYGDGNQTRSFCYVDDTIEGIYKMMNSDEFGPINIGNPHCEFTLNNLVEIFEKIYNKELQVVYLNATQDDPKQRKPDISKAKNLLDWEPKILLEEGLLKTINYFEKRNSDLMNKM